MATSNKPQTIKPVVLQEGSGVKQVSSNDKGYRGNASQFFVAAELCRRGFAAVVALGNCPNTDILCSNREGTRFVHVQVKTFVPGKPTCTIGLKGERDYGDRFFWVLGGIPTKPTEPPTEYYVIPSRVMAQGLAADFIQWRDTPGKFGQQRNAENQMRNLFLPPKVGSSGFNIADFKNRWDLITTVLQHL